MDQIYLCDIDRLADLIAEKLSQRMEGAAGQPKLYTIDALAERYSTSPDTIRRRVNAGEFGEVVRTGKRGLLIPADGVRLYDATHTGTVAAPARRALKKRSTRENPGPI